ncbi:MAG TPA: TrkA family potassium uptake protein [Egibacteraceae bacterium]|nr:TrkA family potassium uptake protein [Egibacteraceae bacterium]
MRVIVAGAGKIGRYVTLDLVGRGHDVTLVELNPETAKVLAGQVRRLTGDACTPSVLERAGARDADVLVAATGDDEDNLVISLLAKQEFGVPRVLARINHPQNEWMFDEAWGVDVAVSPPHVFTALVEEAVTAGDLVPLLKLEHGQVELLEARLEHRSTATGRRVEELDLPADSRLVAVVRNGHVLPVRRTTPLAEGDEVLALVRADAKDAFRTGLLGADGGSEAQA